MANDNMQTLLFLSRYVPLRMKHSESVPETVNRKPAAAVKSAHEHAQIPSGRQGFSQGAIALRQGKILSARTLPIETGRNSRTNLKI